MAVVVVVIVEMVVTAEVVVAETVEVAVAVVVVFVVVVAVISLIIVHTIGYTVLPLVSSSNNVLRRDSCPKTIYVKWQSLQNLYTRHV